jgi:hypothetical protein
MKRSVRPSRIRFASYLLESLAMALSLVGLAFAQTAKALPSAPPSPSGPFTLLSPGTLNVTVYGGGYVSADYATTDQGLQIAQSITQNIGLIGRATGYQLYINDNFDSPLNPGTGHSARLNFGRFQGGFDFHLFEGTYLSILGGGDVGDSDAATVEEDFSTWLFWKSAHATNLAASSIYNTENKVVSNEVDLRIVAYSTQSYTLMAGCGGAIYAAGFVHGLAGQGGPIIGLYLPNWGFGVDLQSGYGSAQEYGELSLYKELRWIE